MILWAAASAALPGRSGQRDTKETASAEPLHIRKAGNDGEDGGAGEDGRSLGRFCSAQVAGISSPVNPPQPAFRSDPLSPGAARCSYLISHRCALAQLAAVWFSYLSESYYRIPLKLPWYPCNFAWIWFDFRRSLCLNRALKYCISSWTVL